MSVTTGLTVGTQPPLRRVLLMLRLARVLRFDVAWTVDHFLGFFPRALWDRDFSWAANPESSPHRYFDYQVLLGHLARRAGRVRLGVGVTEPTRRHPVLLAQAFMTLSHLTSRPPILGIGAGERENIEPYGLDFETPVGRLEEALQIIRLCFESQGPIDFAGRHFTLDRALLDLQPAPGRTPEIWIAAHQPRTLRLTGEYADGWYPTFPMSPERYGELLGVIRRTASDAGRDGAAITPGWQAVVVVGRSEAHARRLLESAPVRFMALLAGHDLWEQAGLDHPLGRGFRGLIDFVPQSFARAELEAAMAKVPVDLLAESVLWGTAEQLHARFRDYVDVGLRHLVIQPASALASRRDAIDGLRAVIAIARRLRR